MHPPRVVLDGTPRIELVGADADVIDADDLGHLFEAVDVSIDAGKKVPDADRAAGLGDRPRMIGADLPTPERRRPHSLRSRHGRVRQQQRLCRDLDRLLRHVFGRVRDVADEAKPITGADHFGAEFSQTLMHDYTGLKIADVVRRVMHELHKPDAPLVRFLQPFQLPVKEIEPLNVGDDRRLSRLVRRFEIGGIQRAADAVIGDQFVQPGETVEVVTVKLARHRRAHHSEGPFRIASEHRPVRHVGQAGDCQRSRAHRVCEIAARPRLRSDAGAAAMAMDIERDGFAQDRERGGGILGRGRRFRRITRSSVAGKHCPDRDQRRAPHPGLGRNDVAMTATIHGVLPTIATALAYAAVIACPARSTMA